MMLQMRLKEVLQLAGLSQADLARAVGLSTTAINLLLNRSLYPKLTDEQTLRSNITNWLKENGVEAEALEGCFDPADGRYRKTNWGGNPSWQGKSQTDDMEVQPMLLRKQSLTPQAKRQFGLVPDPFANPRSSNDLFVSPDIRYVRESLYQATQDGVFLAIVGESGSGKSTIRQELHERLRNDTRQTIIIEPYVIGMEENDRRGKPLKASDISAAILYEVAPELRLPLTSEARFRAVHKALRESFRLGNRHILIIEEAHSLPIHTLRHLKRFFELEEGFARLLSVVMIGQTELGERLSERNPSVREVVQRCEIATLQPLDANLTAYLKHRFDLAGKTLDNLVTPEAIEAIRQRLQGFNQSRGHYSMLHPLAVHNLLIAAFNAAAEVGADRVEADIVMGV